MKTFKNTVSIEGLGQNPHALFDTLHIDTLDQIGITNVTPGNGGWAVGNNGSTKNSTLIRNFGVSSGQSDWDCGQEQWSTLQQDDVSNLGIHQNICSLTSVDISYSFHNPALIDSSDGHKYFMFDIFVKASNDSTYFNHVNMFIKYDTLTFGSNIGLFTDGRLSAKRLPPFSDTTYSAFSFVSSNFQSDVFSLLIGTNSNVVPLSRVKLTQTELPLFHVIMRADSCNKNTGLSFINPYGGLYNLLLL